MCPRQSAEITSVAVGLSRAALIELYTGVDVSGRRGPRSVDGLRRRLQLHGTASLRRPSTGTSETISSLSISLVFRRSTVLRLQFVQKIAHASCLSEPQEVQQEHQLRGAAWRASAPRSVELDPRTVRTDFYATVES